MQAAASTDWRKAARKEVPMPDHGAALRQVAQFLEEVGLAKFGSCGLLACTAWCTAACALLSTVIHGAGLSQVGT